MLTLSACGNVEENKEVTEPDSDTVTEVVKSATESGSETETVKPVTESEPEPQTVESATEPAEEYSKTLVVYFSHTGNTKPVAEYIHDLVGGDLVRLEPVNPYPEGYSDALDPAKQEQRENARPEIQNTIEHFGSYEVIYLGYPIWWGTTPMLINTFLESYDFSGKTVVPFATSGGTGIAKSIEDIRGEIPSADVRDGLLVRDNDDIIPWLQQLGLYE
jgi:flavodoxin